MEINGKVDSTELEFTVEVDTDEIWREIEDSVNDAAYEAAREAAQEEMDNRSSDVDFAEGASQLLNDYSPGTGCQLARDFETAVQGAVAVNDWLTNQIGEHQQLSGLTEDAVRDIVRTEIRHFLADASTAVRERQNAGFTV
jgi:hypothetical protein